MANDPKAILDRQYLEMRWRCLSLAADLDRVDRAARGSGFQDSRLENLRKAIAILSESTPNRAEKVQMLLSDLSPAPGREVRS